MKEYLKPDIAGCNYQPWTPVLSSTLSAERDDYEYDDLFDE